MASIVFLLDRADLQLKRNIQFKVFIVHIGKVRSRESDQDLPGPRLLPSRVIFTILPTIIKTKRPNPLPSKSNVQPSPQQNFGKDTLH